MLKDVSEMGLFTKTAKSKAEKEQTKAAKVKTVAAKAEEEEEDEEEAKYDAMADIEAIKEGLGVVAEGQEAATTMRKALGVDAPAELDAIDLAFEQLEECLRTLMESIESGAGEETAAEPDEEDDEEYRKRGATSQYRRQVATLRVLQTAQRKALAKLQAERHAEKRAAEKAQYDNSFAGLHGRGAVVAEDRDAFDLMAKAKGVDYAANFFDAKARRDNPYQNFRIPEKDVKAQYSEQEFAQRYALVKKMSPHLSEKKEADKAQLEEITKRALATHAGQK
jgi:pyruvate/2-oxoglutarate dehydrogenase complex dihydrolipoamide acyltransferase (E2) component